MRPFIAVTIIFTLTSFLIAPDTFAIRDETNQKRWDRPCKDGPDKVVPGFLINMGPTGARGTLTSN